MYDVNETLSRCRFLFIDQGINSREGGRIIRLDKSEFIRGDRIYKIDHINHKFEEIGGYENGIWRIPNEGDMYILQDYGDLEGTAPIGYKEIKDIFIYQKEVIRSIAVFEGKLGILAEIGKFSLLFTELMDHEPFNFDRLDAKRPYNAKFLIPIHEGFDSEKDIVPKEAFDNEVEFHVTYRGDVPDDVIKLGFTYMDIISSKLALTDNAWEVYNYDDILQDSNIEILTEKEIQEYEEFIGEKYDVE